MSVQSEITRLENAKSAIKAAIEGKGVTVPDATLLDGMAALIDSIEAGGGGYEVSFGLINLAEDSTTITFEHGLSKAPDYVSIFLPIGQSYKSYANSLRTYYKRRGFIFDSISENRDVYATRSSTSYVYHENGTVQGDVDFIIDDTTVTASECKFSNANNPARIWISGKSYMWICISGDVVFPYQ